MHNFFPFTYHEHLSRPLWTKKIYVKNLRQSFQSINIEFRITILVHDHEQSLGELKQESCTTKKKSLTTNPPNSNQNKCIVPVRRSKKKCTWAKCATETAMSIFVHFFSFQPTFQNFTSLSFSNSLMNRNLITRCPLILIWQQLHPVS